MGDTMNRVILGGLCLALSSLAMADVVGLRAGVSGWNAGVSGDVQSGPAPVDVESDLGFSDDPHVQAYVSLEHPVPLIPAVKLQFTSLDSEATGQLNQSFEGIAFDGATTTTADLTHADLLVYWELLDNVVSLDLGLQGKRVSGELVVTGTSGGDTAVASVDIDETVPLAYAAVGADLPLTGLGVYVSAAGVKYEDNQVLDLNAKVFYDIKLIGFELGWRELRLQLDDIEGMDADLAIGGPYAGINLHF